MKLSNDPITFDVLVKICHPFIKEMILTKSAFKHGLRVAAVHQGMDGLHVAAVHPGLIPGHAIAKVKDYCVKNQLVFNNEMLMAAVDKIFKTASEFEAMDSISEIVQFV